jgi:hypothetical protein
MKNINSYLLTSIIGATIAYMVSKRLQTVDKNIQTELLEDVNPKPRVDPEFLNYEYNSLML